jgi:hypothetical protein
MSQHKCKCGYVSRKAEERDIHARICAEASPTKARPAVGGEFYKGIEWLACWLLDNVEGETITEEQLRPWAAKAWKAHLKRQNGTAKR